MASYSSSVPPALELPQNSALLLPIMPPPPSEDMGGEADFTSLPPPPMLPVAASVNASVLPPPLDCGDLDMSDFETVQSCSFWVEGVSMVILGVVAIVTNFLSIYVFTR